jgi:hypothetical protein
MFFGIIPVDKDVSATIPVLFCQLLTKIAIQIMMTGYLVSSNQLIMLVMFLWHRHNAADFVLVSPFTVDFLQLRVVKQQSDAEGR